MPRGHSGGFYTNSKNVGWERGAKTQPGPMGYKG